MDENEIFPAGTRVKVQGWFEWPDGTVGTVRTFPEFVQQLCSESPDSPNDFFAAGLGRSSKGSHGAIVTQHVEFDQPTDDGSGDGPYLAGEIPVKCLVQFDGDSSQAGHRPPS